MLRVGVIVNPIAGIGGPTALKGSDGADVQRMALARGARTACQRTSARGVRPFAEPFSGD